MSIPWTTFSVLKMAVFLDVAPCSLAYTSRRFRGTSCLHHQDDDGGSKHCRAFKRVVVGVTVAL
jgi:hypothetical protein